MIKYVRIQTAKQWDELMFLYQKLEWTAFGRTLLGSKFPSKSDYPFSYYSNLAVYFQTDWKVGEVESFNKYKEREISFLRCKIEIYSKLFIKRIYALLGKCLRI